MRGNKRPKTKFGEWLTLCMAANYMSCEDVANRLHVTRQVIQQHASGHHLSSYVWCIAYASIFDVDQEYLWQLVEQET